MVAHHSALINLVQGSIVVCNLDIATTTISKIVDMLWVEGSLEGRKIRIHLRLVRTIHSY